MVDLCCRFTRQNHLLERLSGFLNIVDSPPGQESLLAQGGKFVGEQVFTDVYWDTQRCGLTERDWWLRARAGRWELKASVARNMKPKNCQQVGVG